MTPSNSHPDPAEERLDLVLESKVESIDLAVTLISTFAESKYGESHFAGIELALREAVANALLHGNKYDLSKKVYLSAELHAHGLVIAIQDEGEGCEPESVPDPLAPDNLLRDSGRGMFLVRACMDEVVWRRAASGGMQLIMTKHYAETHAKHQMCLTASQRQLNGVTVVDLSGRLVLGEESKMIREELKNLASRGQKKILLNLAGVSFIDSSGLGALIGGYTTVTSQQGQLKLVNVSQTIHEILQMTRLLAVFEVHSNEAAAVQSFH